MTPSSKADTMFKKAFIARLRHQAELLLPKFEKLKGFRGIGISVEPEFVDAKPPQGWYIAIYADPQRVDKIAEIADRNVLLPNGDSEPIKVPIEVVSLSEVQIQHAETSPATSSRGR